jgi:hypothetical protein
MQYCYLIFNFKALKEEYMVNDDFIYIPIIVILKKLPFFWIFNPFFMLKHVPKVFLESTNQELLKHPI